MKTLMFVKRHWGGLILLYLALTILNFMVLGFRFAPDCNPVCWEKGYKTATYVSHYRTDNKMALLIPGSCLTDKHTQCKCSTLKLVRKDSIPEEGVILLDYSEKYYLHQTVGYVDMQEK